MKILTSLGLSAILALAMASGAAAQTYRPEPAQPLYRDGPAVMTPRPQADPNAGNDAVASSFRQWNRRSGTPRILVFWSRSLTDDATSEFETYFAEVIKATPWRMSTVQIGGSTRTNEGKEERIGSSLSSALQASFITTLINSGGQVIDRNALMRKVSTKQSREDRMDKQYLESLALEQGIQYLVEIVPDYRPASPTDLKFTVKITHLPSSAVRAQFISTGLPPQGRSQIVAGAYGFVRATEVTNTVENVGAQIAYDVMGKFQ